jgi:hypothetical protein
MHLYMDKAYVHVIAARRCMYDNEAMHLCVSFCVLMYKAHAQCDWCEAMHACALFVCCYAQGTCSLCLP